MTEQPELVSATRIDDGLAIELVWKGGLRSRFHAIWLRDNALDEKTRSGSNGQRKITLANIPLDTSIDTVQILGEQVSVRFLPEDHTVCFPQIWLWSHQYDRHKPEITGRMPAEAQHWRSDFSLGDITAGYCDCRDNVTKLMQWLSHVRHFGIALLQGGPVQPAALLSVVEWFGFVRYTNYGELFDVRTTIDPDNLAYTNLGLQPHTDNPYRDPVPTLQLLYCLENSAYGGASLVVDGFQAAQKLRDEDPEGFACLTRYCARFEYHGTGGVQLYSRKPIIELTPDGELQTIRFNNRSAGPIIDVPYKQMALYYDAYRRFASIIDDPAMQLTFKLEPGECFIVDNTRMLHGRTGYEASNGSRWLQGCYADMDGLLSTLAVLKKNAAGIAI
ncbi:MAG: TauD/TfdA family dioxygenase [Granulosicoccus sp.]